MDGPNCAHHRFKIEGRTTTGWQYILRCQKCGVAWYPSLMMFGAKRIKPQRFQKLPSIR